MKNYILFICICSLYQFSFSQSKTNLKFFPLTAIDTISDIKQIEEIQIDNELEYENFFIKDWIDKKRYGHKALFCKKGEICVVYDLPDNDDGGFGFFELSDNNRFVTYNTSHGHGSRNHVEGTGTHYIIDLKNISSLLIRTYLDTESYDEETEKNSISKCSIEIVLKANILTVKRKTTKDLSYKDDFNEDCLPLSGKYKITNGKLIKIKSSH